MMCEQNEKKKKRNVESYTHAANSITCSKSGVIRASSGLTSLTQRPPSPAPTLEGGGGGNKTPPTPASNDCDKSQDASMATEGATSGCCVGGASTAPTPPWGDSSSIITTSLSSERGRLDRGGASSSCGKQAGLLALPPPPPLLGLLQRSLMLGVPRTALFGGRFPPFSGVVSGDAACCGGGGGVGGTPAWSSWRGTRGVTLWGSKLYCLKTASWTYHSGLEEGGLCSFTAMPPIFMFSCRFDIPEASSTELPSGVLERSGGCLPGPGVAWSPPRESSLAAQWRRNVELRRLRPMELLWTRLMRSGIAGGTRETNKKKKKKKKKRNK